MSFLSTIWNVVKPAIPAIWGGAKFIGDAITGLVSSMDEVPLTRIAGMQGMDDPIDEKERKQEEILVVTNADITKRQIAEFVENQQRIERFAFQMPVTGLSRSSVVLSLHCEYTYSTNATDLKIKNVNYDDHVSIHIMPKDFSFYKNLLKHDLFKFSNFRIVSSSTSGFDTTTTIGFIPVTTDTNPYTNGLLMQLCKRLEVKTGEEVSYNIRYCSPDVVSYEKRENGSLKNIKSQFMALEPNKILKTDYITGLPEGTDLSYGTVVIIKQNVGSIVGMSFNVNLEFDVWDYIINGFKLSEVKDKDLDGKDDDDEQSGDDENPDDGQGSQPAAPKGRVGRRTVKK